MRGLDAVLDGFDNTAAATVRLYDRLESERMLADGRLHSYLQSAAQGSVGISAAGVFSDPFEAEAVWKGIIPQLSNAWSELDNMAVRESAKGLYYALSDRLYEFSVAFKHVVELYDTYSRVVGSFHSSLVEQARILAVERDVHESDLVGRLEGRDEIFRRVFPGREAADIYYAAQFEFLEAYFSLPLKLAQLTEKAGGLPVPDFRVGAEEAGSLAFTLEFLAVEKSYIMQELDRLYASKVVGGGLV